MHPNWWANLSFTQNIAASLIGFLIGVPIALTGLAAFTADREHRIELARVNDATRAAWENFRDSVRRFCNEERMEALFHLTLNVQELKDSIAQLLQDYNDKPELSNNFSAFQEELESKVARFNQAYTTATDVIGYAEYIAIDWAQLVGAWNALESQIKPQRSHLGLEWFDRDTDALLRNRLSIQQQPLRDFLHLHFYDSGAAGITTMAEFRRKVMTLTPPDSSDSERIRPWFTVASILYTKEKVADYYKKALTAGTELSELEDACDTIEAQNWPTEFANPIQPSH